MKVCIPVEEDKGLESLPYPHFGSAPMFLVCDLETEDLRAVENPNLHHAHGTCNPVVSVSGMEADAVLVGGIGPRAVQGLNRVGIKVYRAAPGSVAVNLEALRSGNIQEVTTEGACNHGHGHGCG